MADFDVLKKFKQTAISNEQLKRYHDIIEILPICAFYHTGKKIPCSILPLKKYRKLYPECSFSKIQPCVLFDGKFDPKLWFFSGLQLQPIEKTLALNEKFKSTIGDLSHGEFIFTLFYKNIPIDSSMESEIFTNHTFEEILDLVLGLSQSFRYAFIRFCLNHKLFVNFLIHKNNRQLLRDQTWLVYDRPEFVFECNISVPRVDYRWVSHEKEPMYMLECFMRGANIPRYSSHFWSVIYKSTCEPLVIYVIEHSSVHEICAMIKIKTSDKDNIFMRQVQLFLLKRWIQVGDVIQNCIIPYMF